MYKFWIGDYIVISTRVVFSVLVLFPSSFLTKNNKLKIIFIIRNHIYKHLEVRSTIFFQKWSIIEIPGTYTLEKSLE